MTIQQQIGEQLKKLRQDNNLSQQEMADQAYMDQKHISKVERGEVKNISLPTIERMAAVFGKKIKIQIV